MNAVGTQRGPPDVGRVSTGAQHAADAGALLIARPRRPAAQESGSQACSPAERPGRTSRCVPDSVSAAWPVRRHSARGKLLDDPGTEGWQVVGPAAGGDVLVGDNLLVYYSPAGIADVGPDARVGSQSTALDDTGLDERPGAVADHADRLAASLQSRGRSRRPPRSGADYRD
jgi:hypothetical protein